MNFTPLMQRVTKRVEVQQLIRAAILNGDLEPGAKVIESKLAANMGISRAPLREAIAALVEEGFLVSVPYEGYFVQSFNNKNLKDLCEMRIGLETLAFKLIWDHRTDKFADTLATRNEDLKQAIVAEDKTCAIEKELALHATVYEFSDNELLLGAWKTLSGRLQLYWSLHQKAQHRLGARIDGHDIYIKLATGNDLNAMIAEIEEHMVRGMQSVSDSI